MKKKYQKPEMKVYEIKAMNTILMASGKVGSVGSTNANMYWDDTADDEYGL